MTLKGSDKKMKSNKLSCLCCGKCCFVALTAYVQQEDFERWRTENRQDILEVIENRHLFWAGDRMISSETGISPKECPFLYCSEGLWLCSVYETRPLVCREYQPGSSQLCPQWKGKGGKK